MRPATKARHQNAAIGSSRMNAPFRAAGLQYGRNWRFAVADRWSEYATVDLRGCSTMYLRSTDPESARSAWCLAPLLQSTCRRAGVALLVVIAGLAAHPPGNIPVARASDICSEGDAAREAAHRYGGRVVSVYYSRDDGGYWVFLQDRQGNVRRYFVPWSC